MTDTTNTPTNEALLNPAQVRRIAILEWAGKQEWTSGYPELVMQAAEFVEGEPARATPTNAPGPDLGGDTHWLEASELEGLPFGSVIHTHDANDADSWEFAVKSTRGEWFGMVPDAEGKIIVSSVPWSTSELTSEEFAGNFHLVGMHTDLGLTDDDINQD